ncbi:FadR/GntR family transcriptional regulator [Cryptosporangium aurantiacum]|uniref:Transcriptional regulator, GntR family n=1 Tax=Cryptosporangium aurantiacum TaxID=134849 RepID=A0A1M7PI78_9ACTN|nr:FCD domain-containing protein [Cryptosporangium aurantiacum]SHN16873.1 transcriptional regulator, GntR family [Cryptosporangium aurantiacum]
MVIPLDGESLVGRSLRAAKTSELIAAHLRGKIVRGELVEGESLPSEQALLEQFDVSRPTLREAFRILEAESLIVIRRGARGARILAPDPAVAARYVGLLLQVTNTTMGDVYAARSVIEPAAAGRLATRRTEQDLAVLNRVVDDLEAAIEAGSPASDLAGWSRVTTEFHTLVLRRAGNNTLAIQSSVLDEVVSTHLAVALHRPANRTTTVREFRALVRSYRRLIELLEARDAEGAEQHWRAHMEAAGRSLLRDGMDSTTVLDLFA